MDRLQHRGVELIVRNLNLMADSVAAMSDDYASSVDPIDDEWLEALDEARKALAAAAAKAPLTPAEQAWLTS